MTDTFLPQPPTVRVGGSELDVVTMASLIDLRVSLSVHAAAVAQMRFEDADFALLDSTKFEIGGAVTVSLPTTDNHAVATFDGEIVSIGVEQGYGGRHELVVVAFDRSHRLSGQSNQMAYLNQKRSDVVSQIAGRHGLTATVDSTEVKEPYLLQTGTDHAFLWELAAAVGFEWFVDGKKLVFRERPSTAGVKLTFGDDLLRFQARYSAADAAVKSLTVRGWDHAQQKSVEGDAAAILGDPAVQDLGSDAPLVTGSHKKAKSAFGKALVVGSSGVRDSSEAKALAGSLARDLLGDACTARGETYGNPNVKPGTMVEVANLGSKLSGKYYVTEVEHVFGVDRPLVTRFTVSGHRQTGLSSTTPVQGSSSWGRDGVVVGVVTNVKDPEKLGRVKVKFPTLGDSIESHWARVVLPGAGSTRGFDFLPEVNDEVVVAFDRGDVRQAVVLGGLWSTKQKPALPDSVASDGAVGKRAIRTRVGHVIEMSDGKKGTVAGDADRYVKISLADGKTKVHVGEDKIDVEAAQGKPITVKSGSAEVTLSGNGDVHLKGVNVTLEGSSKVTMKAPQIEVKGNVGLKLESGGQFEAKGATVKVEGSAMAEIKGGMLKLN
jgi:phage protein D/phage baseplate assembly protein gpV